NATKSAPTINVSAGAMALAMVFADSSSAAVGTIGNSFGTQTNVTSNRRISMAQRLFASAGATGTTSVTVGASTWAIWHAALLEAVEEQPDPPELTDVDDDETLEAGQEDATFAGTDLGDTTGDRTIELVQGSIAVEQTQV